MAQQKAKAPVVETSPEPAAQVVDAPQPEQPPRFFVVNPTGAVHEVTEAHLWELVRQPGWRVASKDDIAELELRDGEQTADDPIVKQALAS
jgi:hypothetical protein